MRLRLPHPSRVEVQRNAALAAGGREGGQLVPSGELVRPVAKGKLDQHRAERPGDGGQVADARHLCTAGQPLVGEAVEPGRPVELVLEQVRQLRDGDPLAVLPVGPHAEHGLLRHDSAREHHRGRFAEQLRDLVLKQLHGTALAVGVPLVGLLQRRQLVDDGLRLAGRCGRQGAADPAGHTGGGLAEAAHQFGLAVLGAWGRLRGCRVVVSHTAIMPSGHVLPATGHVLPATGHVLPATGHVLPADLGGALVWETKRRGDEGAGWLSAQRSDRMVALAPRTSDRWARRPRLSRTAQQSDIWVGARTQGPTPSTPERAARRTLARPSRNRTRQVAPQATSPPASLVAALFVAQTDHQPKSPEQRDRSPEQRDRSPEQRDRSPEQRDRSPEQRDRSRERTAAASRRRRPQFVGYAGQLV